MTMETCRHSGGRVGAAVAGVVLALWPAAASAHFVLDDPPSQSVQDGLGNPQKNPPCGEANPGTIARPTGDVTTYEEGQAITITVDETIFHPGHYRVVIAQDPSQLPEDPHVTPGTTPCGTADITTTPALPVLGDGLLLHAAPFNGSQSMQVQLPPGFTCTNCTLQVVEFMANHGLNNPGGCYYHHCAIVSVVAAAAPDAGTSASSGGTASSSGGGSSAPAAGCECANASTGPVAWLGVLGMLWMRRKARAQG